jgi:hypothetical protein
MLLVPAHWKIAGGEKSLRAHLETRVFEETAEETARHLTRDKDYFRIMGEA